MRTPEGIREARLQLGWTQAELGRRAGLSQPYVSRVEQGHIKAPERLLAALGLAEARPRAPLPPHTALQPEALAWKPTTQEQVSLLLEVRRWQRPDPSGDAFSTAQLPRGGYLITAIDVAGHGPEQLPKVTYLLGWLRGWGHGLTVVPRLESLVEDLERELTEAGLRAAWYAAIIAPHATSPNLVSFQGTGRRFPSPLLLTGTPPSSLPTVGRRDEVVRHDLWAPWRLTVASDGLLRRLGDGAEKAGLQKLAEWQAGPARDQPLVEHLATKMPIADDELYADVTWQRWDEHVRVNIDDAAEVHRVKRVLEQDLALPPARRSELVVAVSEALANVRRHAYANQDGPASVFWRDEGPRLRVEIEDYGNGLLPFAEGRGIAVMRGLSDSVDVRQVYPRGVAVSLVKNKGEADE